jgi:hypothetical protein
MGGTGGARGSQREDRIEWPGSTGPMYFSFCRLDPFSPSHHCSLWLLPVISILLSNTVSPVQACVYLSISLERFRFVGLKKKRSWAF